MNRAEKKGDHKGRDAMTSSVRAGYTWSVRDTAGVTRIAFHFNCANQPQDPEKQDLCVGGGQRQEQWRHTPGLAYSYPRPNPAVPACRTAWDRAARPRPGHTGSVARPQVRKTKVSVSGDQGKTGPHLPSSTPTWGCVSCWLPATALRLSMTGWRTPVLKALQSTCCRLAGSGHLSGLGSGGAQVTPALPSATGIHTESLTLSCLKTKWLLPPSGNTGLNRDCDLDVRHDFLLATKTL